MAISLRYYTEYASHLIANYIKLFTAKPILSETKMLSKEASFQQYVICGDIRRGYRE